jgi:hypothetical protein
MFKKENPSLSEKPLLINDYYSKLTDYLTIYKVEKGKF